MKPNFVKICVEVVVFCLLIVSVVDVCGRYGNQTKWLVNVSLKMRNGNIFLWQAKQLSREVSFGVPSDAIDLNMDRANSLVWKQLNIEWKQSEVSQGKYDQNRLAKLYYRWGIRLAENGQMGNSLSWLSASRLIAPWWSFFWAEEARGLLAMGKKVQAVQLLEKCQLFVAPRRHCSQLLVEIDDLANKPVGFMNQEIEQWIKN